MSSKNHQAVIIFLSCFFNLTTGFAQNVEKIYLPNIKTAQLFSYGNQQSLPVYTLNSSDKLELEFDDLEGSVKSYYYTGIHPLH